MCQSVDKCKGVNVYRYNHKNIHRHRHTTKLGVDQIACKMTLGLVTYKIYL